MNPFLSWVGSKRDLSVQIAKRFPRKIRKYQENFLGSGAVFFELADRIESARLSDANPDLILAFQEVRDNPEAIMAELDALAVLHAEDSLAGLNHREPQHLYYWVRGLLNSEAGTRTERAARFIYLIKKAYNGVGPRVNSQGLYNAPIGHGKRPLYDRETILACSRALQVADIFVADGAHEVGLAPGGSHCYIDSPYIGTFDQYTADRFDLEQHARLALAARQAGLAGVNVMVSNSWAAADLYREPPWMVQKVWARRSVNCKGDERQDAPEMLALWGRWESE